MLYCSTHPKKVVLIRMRYCSVTHPEKIWFPEDNITKQDIINYYRTAAPLLLPTIANHPLTLHRFPDGITHTGFFQKEIPNYLPSLVTRILIRNKTVPGSTTYPYLTAHNTKGLLCLINTGAITIHQWQSGIKNLNFPTRLVFDLDPGSRVLWEDIVTVAYALKKLLESHGFTPTCMLTGSRGVHVIAQIPPRYKYDTIRTYTHRCAKLIHKKYPSLVTIQSREKNKSHRVYIDTLRNSYGATTVVPYAVRARPGAPVAMPISWRSLSQKNMRSDYFTLPKALHVISRRTQ